MSHRTGQPYRTAFEKTGPPSHQMQAGASHTRGLNAMIGKIPGKNRVLFAFGSLYMVLVLMKFTLSCNT